MELVGDSSVLSLSDLLQAKGQAAGACRILIRGKRGDGLLHLSGGRVLHARYGDETGQAAAVALLAEEAVAYRVTGEASRLAPNMDLDHRALLLEAALHLDHQRRAPVPPPRRGRLTALLGGLGLAAAALLAVSSSISWRRSEAAAAPGEPAAGRPPPVPAPREASAFDAPGDSLPVLLVAELPRSPAPDLALRPTVVLRLLVDEHGRVAQAEVYQHRPELVAFEQAALTAAARFTFRPGRHLGQATPTWVNWPVDFL